MFFGVVAILTGGLIAVLIIVAVRQDRTIRTLEEHLTTLSLSETTPHPQLTILDQLRQAPPSTLWVISVPHAQHGRLVYTALMKEPTTIDQQMQDWAGRNLESLNPLDPNHHKAWRRLVNTTVFQKVKNGMPLTWVDLVLIKIGYERQMPYSDIEQGYREFISGTMRDPASTGTQSGLQALRDSAAKTVSMRTYYDLPSFKEVTD